VHAAQESAPARSDQFVVVAAAATRSGVPLMLRRARMGARSSGWPALAAAQARTFACPSSQ
jgi:hypothetical protein